MHTFLRTRAWAMTRTRRVLSQSPRKMAADGGLSCKETNKVGSQDWPETSKRCYNCPTVTLHIRGLILVGPVNHEGDQLLPPSSQPLDLQPRLYNQLLHSPAELELWRLDPTRSATHCICMCALAGIGDLWSMADMSCKES